MQPIAEAVQWQDGYEIHYASVPNSLAPVAGPITVYFPLSGEAFAGHFLPTPGLTDPASADFVPSAQLVNPGSYCTDHFWICQEGIRTSNPHITGLTRIVERLVTTGELKEALRPCARPKLRWENVQLTPLPPPSALEAYRDALREEYGCGFVEARCYQVGPGDVEDAVILLKRYPATPVQFLETLRHPRIVEDFGITETDNDRLFQPSHWNHYSPFLLSGFLAQTLVEGGAYSPTERWVSAVSSSLKLADDVFAAYHRNYQDLEFHVCRTPWCRRFFDVAWDHTWIIFERSSRRLTVVLASDTD